jgi:hypothetical protein
MGGVISGGVSQGGAPQCRHTALAMPQFRSWQVQCLPEAICVGSDRVVTLCSLKPPFTFAAADCSWFYCVTHRVIIPLVGRSVGMVPAGLALCSRRCPPLACECHAHRVTASETCRCMPAPHHAWVTQCPVGAGGGLWAARYVSFHCDHITCKYIPAGGSSSRRYSEQNSSGCLSWALNGCKNYRTEQNSGLSIICILNKSRPAAIERLDQIHVSARQCH